MNRLTDNEFIRFPVIVHQCLADYFLFGMPALKQCSARGTSSIRKSRPVSSRPIRGNARSRADSKVWRRCPRLYCPDAAATAGSFLRVFVAGSSLLGHAEGLFQAERHSGRIVVWISVQSHAATLGKEGSFNVMANGSKGLVALHRHTVGVGMKQGGIALPLRRRAVGQGKQYPYLGTPSAGTAESGKGLW